MFLEKLKDFADMRDCIGAVFLYLKRAFDTVDHQVLLVKCAHLNFSAEAINWIKSYLFKQETAHSSYLGCSWGVPQGSIVGPILFFFFFCILMTFPIPVKMVIFRCMQMML